MAKKSVSMSQVESLCKVLKTLNVRLLRSDSGPLYLTTTQPGRGEELQEFDFKEACSEVKWVLRAAKKEQPEAVIAETVQYLQRAVRSGPSVQVSRRVAERDGKIFVDLCDSQRRVVEITPDGWKVVTDYPGVYFYRPAEAMPLPLPRQEGSLRPLRELLAILDDTSWMLALGWLGTTLREQCDHPLLALSGEPGSAKTSITRYLARIIDPREEKAKGLQIPNDTQDLQLSAFNRWVLPLDEVDRLTPHLSRTVATICTGGGLEKRKKYADTKTVCVSFNRPVVLNGLGRWLDEFRIRDRAIPIGLKRLSPKSSLRDTTLSKLFADGWPDTLGALFTLASVALRKIRDDEPPVTHTLRMREPMEWADFCVQAAGFPEGEFIRAVTAAQEQAAGNSTESWVLLDPLLTLAKSGFHGSASQLLSRLNAQPGSPLKDRHWPQNAVQLGKEISEHVADLHRCGVVAEPDRDRNGRTWTLRHEPPATNQAESLTPISETEQTRMQARLARYAAQAEVDWVSFCHSDDSVTLFGRSAEVASKELGRPVESGRTLRVTPQENDKLSQTGDTVFLS